MITIIAAVDRNGVLGKDGKIPWNLPADLKRFKKVTFGHPVIMGRKTYDSINKPLFGRINIVISRNREVIKGCIVASSLEDALKKAKRHDENIFIIGGAQIFNIAMPLADKLDMAFVDVEVDGDVFFPEYDLSEWNKISSSKHDVDAENAFNIEWILYERKRKI